MFDKKKQLSKQLNYINTELDCSLCCTKEDSLNKYKNVSPSKKNAILINVNTMTFSQETKMYYTMLPLHCYN